MKKYLKFAALAALVLVQNAGAQTAPSLEGQETSNAGDYTTEVFRREHSVILQHILNVYGERDLVSSRARELEDRISGHRSPFVSKYTPRSWGSSSLIIEVTDDPIRIESDRGLIEVDARNWKDDAGRDRILYNRGRWDRLSVCDREKLVHHELLGRMGLERTGEYPISSRMDAYLEGCTGGPRRKTFQQREILQQAYNLVIVPGLRIDNGRSYDLDDYCRRRGFVAGASAFSGDVQRLPRRSVIVSLGGALVDPYDSESAFVLESVTCSRW